MTCISSFNFITLHEDEQEKKERDALFRGKIKSLSIEQHEIKKILAALDLGFEVTIEHGECGNFRKVTIHQEFNEWF